MPLQGEWGPEVARVQLRGHNHQRKLWVMWGQEAKTLQALFFFLPLILSRELTFSWAPDMCLALLFPFSVYLIVLATLLHWWLILFPFYGWGSQGSEKLGNLPRVIQLRGSRTGLGIWWRFKARAVSWHQGPFRIAHARLLSTGSHERWRPRRIMINIPRPVSPFLI